MRMTWQWIVAVACGVCGSAAAWDERGHAICTRLAVAGLPGDVPAWVKEPESVRRLVYLAAEPDRWRGTRLGVLVHVNSPDHYLDVELLEPFGLTLQTLPRLRYEYVGRLAAQRAVHPDRFSAGAADDDPNLSKVTPGMLPYEIVELHAELVSGWQTLTTFERHKDQTPAWMATAARERVLQTMGLMSHYVADAAQPLHTTKHFNGWVGENPKGFTTSKQFHAFIDGGVLEKHGLTTAALIGQVRPARQVPADGAWDEIVAHIDRSFRKVEPLYELERSGALPQEAGREFIAERLLDAGSMLGGLWTAAWRAGTAGRDEYLERWLASPERHDREPPAASRPGAGR